MKTESVKMLHDYVIAKRIPPETKTKGGLIIPEAHIEEQNIATVIAAGPGRRTKRTGFLKPLPVKIGEKIIFDKMSYLDIDYNGEPCIMVREDKILGVLEE